jgi:3-oxoacyl-[acyl-carrier-protein] synthase-1
MAAEILGVGMITAVGLSAAETAGAVRAGIVGVRATPFLDLRDEPILMGVVPDDHLPDLADELGERHTLGERQARTLALGGAALAEALASVPGLARVPLLLAVPDDEDAPPPADMLAQLAFQARADLDLARSRTFAGDRAGGMIALAHALAELGAQPGGAIVVGGADSFLDMLLLHDLDEEGRLKAAGVYDGFRPGEGAAFVVLGAPGLAARRGLHALARIESAAVAVEVGHRHSDLPYRGDGLAAAVAAAIGAAGVTAPIRTVYAGLNGEHLGAKEWGVASLRHADRFAPGVEIHHPVECLGDVGAALGPALIALAAIGIQRGYRGSPCLVWCSSDREPRGAAVLRGAVG